MKKNILIVFTVLCTVISCSKGSDGGNNNNTTNNNNNNNNNNTTCTGTKSFANDVSPIIQSVCAVSGCHNSSSTNGPGPLTTYQQISAAKTNIRSAVSSGLMPKNGTLSADQKNAIICWIDQGANNN
jgi:hypothetical protein